MKQLHYVKNSNIIVEDKGPAYANPRYPYNSVTINYNEDGLETLSYTQARKDDIVPLTKILVDKMIKKVKKKIEKLEKGLDRLEKLSNTL